jgi:hypothetical protein
MRPPKWSWEFPPTVGGGKGVQGSFSRAKNALVQDDKAETIWRKDDKAEMIWRRLPRNGGNAADHGERLRHAGGVRTLLN